MNIVQKTKVQELLTTLLSIIDDQICDETISEQYKCLSIRADDAYQAMFETRDEQLNKCKAAILEYAHDCEFIRIEHALYPKED